MAYDCCGCAEAAVARVRALHAEVHDGSCSDREHCTPLGRDGYMCGECYDDWPCPTIRALDAP